MRSAVLLSLVATAFAANTYVGETTSTSCVGSLSSFALTPGQSTCYPQQGASVWLSTDGYACTVQLFASDVNCQGTPYNQKVNNDSEDTCLTEQGTGGSFLVTCDN